MKVYDIDQISWPRVIRMVFFFLCLNSNVLSIVKQIEFKTLVEISCLFFKINFFGVKKNWARRVTVIVFVNLLSSVSVRRTIMRLFAIYNTDNQSLKKQKTIIFQIIMAINFSTIATLFIVLRSYWRSNEERVYLH